MEFLLFLSYFLPSWACSLKSYFVLCFNSIFDCFLLPSPKPHPIPRPGCLLWLELSFFSKTGLDSAVMLERLAGKWRDIGGRWQGLASVSSSVLEPVCGCLFGLVWVLRFMFVRVHYELAKQGSGSIVLSFNPTARRQGLWSTPISQVRRLSLSEAK